MSENQIADKRYGPVFAPDSCAPTSGIGPALPVELLQSRQATTAAPDHQEAVDQADLDMIGPMIPGYEMTEELRHMGSNVGAKGSNSHVAAENKPQRDAWMTEIMPVTKDAGLKPRKFRQGAVPTSRDSTWFKTPGEDDAEAERCAAINPYEELAAEAKLEYDRTADEKMAQRVDAFNKEKKRGTSLLELHEQKLKRRAEGIEDESESSSNSSAERHKKLKKKKTLKKSKYRHSSDSDDSSDEKKKRKKKKKKKSSKKAKKDGKKEKQNKVPVRVPFDRDRDLKTNVMDAAKRNAIIQRSKELSGRFSAGSKKFL